MLSLIHIYAEANVAGDSAKYIAKKGYQSPDLTEMPDKRCLGCSTVCETCADVCPNRANVAIKVAGKCQEQVIHCLLYTSCDRV